MRAYSNDARGPTREDSALRREGVGQGVVEQWPRSVDRYQSPSIGHKCETNAIFSSSPSSFLVFSFFFLFLCYKRMESILCFSLVKDGRTKEGGTSRISHDFLLSWLRVKNHRLESVDS